MKKYPTPNKHGVFQEEDCEVLLFEIDYLTWAKIRLVEFAPDKWTFGVDYSIPNAGGGWAPSLSTMVLPTREDALFSAVHIMENWCANSMARKDRTEREQELLAKILAWLETHKQLKLF